MATETRLRGLSSSVSTAVTQDILDGHVRLDPAGFLVEPVGRDVPLEAFHGYVETAMQRFRERPTASDSWLAPRLHHALRLTRREAADRSIWTFLALVARPDYLVWRWSTKGAVARERALGPEYKHAFGRLWWGAELSRNGSDYGPTERMFVMQDIPNNPMRMDLFHNRAIAVALVDFLSRLADGSPAAGDDVNRIAKAVNLVMTTTALDAIAPDPGPDAHAISQWIAEVPDETLYMDQLPPGPVEPGIDPAAMRRADALVRRIASDLGYPVRTVDADLPF